MCPSITHRLPSNIQLAPDLHTFISNTHCQRKKVKGTERQIVAENNYSDARSVRAQQRCKGWHGITSFNSACMCDKGKILGIIRW